MLLKIRACSNVLESNWFDWGRFATRTSPLQGNR
jgi:hypothetical protein